MAAALRAAPGSAARKAIVAIVITDKVRYVEAATNLFTPQTVLGFAMRMGTDARSCYVWRPSKRSGALEALYRATAAGLQVAAAIREPGMDGPAKRERSLQFVREACSGLN